MVEMGARHVGIENLRFAAISPAVAIFLAIMLLVTFGVAFRTLSARLNGGSTPPIAAGTLARVPVSIGDWSGSDVELDPAVVVAAQVDDYVYRYYDRSGGGRVSFFVAGGARPRDLMPHRPEVCYPSAGWSLRKTRAGVANSGQISIPYRVLEFGRGGLAPERAIVLNYYLIDGRAAADVSALRSLSWSGATPVRSVFQVQIAARPNAGTTLHDAEQFLTEFAVLSADPIGQAIGGAGE